jgi:hypothetical protein
MSKKMMVLPLPVVSAALFAMPAVASAHTWHLDTAPTSFSVSGSGGSLTSTAGITVTCTGTSGSGTCSTTTEGTISLLFSGCKEAFGLACTTAGQASGVMKSTVKIDAIMVSSTAEKKPGLLFTPDASVEPTSGLKEYNNAVCFGIPVKVFGKGMIGTVSAPACGVASTTSTLAFGSSAAGVQADQTWTGSSFDLVTNLTSSHPTWSFDGNTTMTFGAARTRTCT